VPLPTHRITAGADDVSSTSAVSNPDVSFERYGLRVVGLAYHILRSMADARTRCRGSTCAGMRE
jgi:hypothetical protein